MNTPSPSPPQRLTYQMIANPGLGARPPPADLDELAALINKPHLALEDTALSISIRLLQTHMQSKVPGWSFFRDLLPSICGWAAQQPWASAPVPLLLRGDGAPVALPRPHVRCLLANAFLLNVRTPARSELPPSDRDGGKAKDGDEGLVRHRDEDSFGKHSWARVFGTRGCVLSANKAVTLLAYFQHALGAAADDDEEGDPGVVIQRVQTTSFPCSGRGGGEAAAGADVAAAAAATVQNPSSWQRWSDSKAPIRASMVNIHTATMESSPARTFVDFANRYVGYHSIIPSMTQEEVLWSVAPEAQPASLLCEAMLDDEAVVVRNVARVSAYSGYLDTFRWQGFWAEQQHKVQPGSSRGDGHSSGCRAPAGMQQDILVLDATVVSGLAKQFAREPMARDLTKAWLGFAASGPPVQTGLGPGGDSGGSNGGGGGNFGDADAISTGNWGCGVFGGHRVLKFTQQLCAVAEANACRPPTRQLRLDFSTFGDEALAGRLREVLAAIEGRSAGKAGAAGTAGEKEAAECAVVQEQGAGCAVEGGRSTAAAGVTVGEVCRLAVEFGHWAGSSDGRAWARAAVDAQEDMFVEYVQSRLGGCQRAAQEGLSWVQALWMRFTS